MKSISKKVSLNAKSRFNESHIRMLTVVTGYTLGDELPVTESLDAFYNLMVTIKTNLATIQTLRSVVRVPITGYAVNKKTVKGALVQQTSIVMDAAYAYAMATSNDLLANQMRIAPSQLNAMSYVQLVEFTGGIIQIVSPLAGAGSLAGYNVTSTTVIAWEALWNELNAVLADPKVAIATRVGLNANIYSMLRECMVLLTNQCDALVSYFKLSNAAYYKSYWSARKLNDHGLSTQLRLTVRNEAGESVPNGEVFIIGTSRSASLDAAGYALVDHLPFGIHTVAVTTTEGTFTYGPFRFKKGKSLTLRVRVGAAADFTPNSAPEGKRSAVIE